MKAVKASLPRALDKPDPAVRFYLFYGPDDSGSRAMANRLLAALNADKLAVAGASLKSDPALLASEASALGLFGGKRAIWIDPAGDEIADAVDALLTTDAVENVTIAVAGALRKGSALLKLAEATPAALAHQSFLPDGRDLERVTIELGRLEGLRITNDVAARVAAASAGNQSVIASELAKFALFLGAAPDHMRDLDQETIDLLGADTGEGEANHLADLALDGDLDGLGDLLQRCEHGFDAIGIVRSLQRRLLQLAPLRSRVEAGQRLDAVLTSPGKPLFWKDKPLIQRLLSRWNAERLAQIGERASALERRLMMSSVPDRSALGEELIAIARAARSASQRR